MVFSGVMVKAFLETALTSIKQTWAPRIEYTFCLACTCGSGDQHYINLAEILTDDSESDNVQCPELEMVAKQEFKPKFTAKIQVVHGAAGKLKKEDEKDAPGKQGHVMISYQWGTQDRMKMIRDKLQQEGYQVWIDIDKIEGSIVEAMGNAVDNATVVLACITQDYQKSQNCRAEAEYAYKMKVPIIPLKVGHFEATSWLGPIIGTKMYYRVDTDEKLNECWPGLLRDLEAKVKAVKEAKNKPAGKSVK
ncbi:uncharacterized protein [Amphiura filiformis]|uniref:uncharacterized protein n=1 Tax=Amphiura filiformis TaxID=82378 RepID=UPI003B217D1E